MTRKGRKARSDNKIGGKKMIKITALVIDKHIDLSTTDVTIKEFADSQTSTNRSKKGTLEVRENQFDMSANDFTEDEGKRSIKKSKSNRSNPNDSEDNHTFSNYPVDIWFLIAQHIRPEDVGCFALICRTTASICETPGFWFSLYKRHYRHVNNGIIPVRLQPDCMVRLQSLRACVIRSLFYTYEPFVARIPELVKQDFHNLKSFWIVGSWVDTDKDDWNFCYKLRINAPTLADRNFSGEGGSSLKHQRDIFFNPEQGCKVLVVS